MAKTFAFLIAASTNMGDKHINNIAELRRRMKLYDLLAEVAHRYKLLIHEGLSEVDVTTKLSTDYSLSIEEIRSIIDNFNEH